MKTYPLTIKLLALLVVAGLASQLRGDDGIAQRAFEAQANAKAPTSSDVTADSDRVPSDKIAAQRTATKPATPRVATIRRQDSTEQPGIKAPSGTLIHPQVQDAGVDKAPPRVSTRAQAEDYHMQQMY